MIPCRNLPVIGSSKPLFLPDVHRRNDSGSTHFTKVQVLKECPKQLQEEEAFPDEWNALQIFSFDLKLVVPCVPAAYYPRFLANTIVVPSILIRAKTAVLGPSKDAAELVGKAVSSTGSVLNPFTCVWCVYFLSIVKT